jgi:GDP-4-dehydro-6-deoxy-D-mannose reductase
MRVLITGINGFVGGHLAEYLREQPGVELWGLALEPTMRLAHLQPYVRLLTADMCQREQVSAALARAQPHLIFHLAGQAFVPESFQNPAQTFNTNILAQLHIFQALIEHQIAARVVTVSSYEVYGQVRPDDQPINEHTPLRPTNPYGVSKIAQDMLALQYHLSHGLDVVRVRPFNHIGPRQNERFVASSFAKQIAAIEQKTQPSVLFVGNLSAQRDFTDVRDMVRAYALAAEHGTAGAVYNIGSGVAVTIEHLLQTLLDASSVAIDVQQDPQRMRPVDIPLVVCDSTRFRTDTGWQPRIPFAQTLGDILHDWRTRIPRMKEIP